MHAAIQDALGNIVAESPSPPPWQEAWQNLRPNCTDEERLAVYRAVRDSGSVPADAGFFLVAWMLDLLTDDRAEAGLRDMEERMEEIRHEHGLDEDVSVLAEGVPDEFRKAMQGMEDAWDNLYVATMEEFGEHDMAQLFRDDLGEFDERYETGRTFFHGADEREDEDDGWLDAFLANVVVCTEADSAMGPFGLRYTCDEDFWEITIHPTPIELVGGKHDGERVVPGFSVNLGQFQALFDSVEDFGWNTIGLNVPDGPHIWLEGVYQGREVVVQVLAYPPEDEEPGLKIEARRKPRRP